MKINFRKFNLGMYTLKITKNQKALLTTITIIIPLLLFMAPLEASSSDLEDPVAAAKMATELGIYFKYDKLKEMSCEKMLPLVELAKKQAELAKEKYSSIGHDIKKEAKYDLTGLNYQYIKGNDKEAVVLIEGKYDFEFPQGRHRVYPVKRYMILKKINGKYFYCGAIIE